MSLKDKTILVTGGSKGLGLGLVEAVVARGAKVTILAREPAALAAAAKRLRVATIRADVTDAEAARRILAEIVPDVLVLNAGAIPRMGRLDQMSWEDFTLTWEIDVRAALFWTQAALNLPLGAGARVLIGSSGAAQQGSPLSGGYAGAKRMLWFMVNYANAIAHKKDLDIRFQALLPMQIIAATGVGDVASGAYAQAAGIDRETFLGRIGAPMPPRQYGELVATVLEDPRYAAGVAFGFKGDSGVTVLRGEAV